MRTDHIMMLVLIALLPAAAFGVWNFGWNALMVIIISVASCVLTEYLFEKLMHRKITIKDYSAAVTGLLLALNLPPEVPFWIPVIGSVFAIVFVKQLWGLRPKLSESGTWRQMFPVNLFHRKNDGLYL